MNVNRALRVSLAIFCAVQLQDYNHAPHFNLSVDATEGQLNVLRSSAPKAETASIVAAVTNVPIPRLLQGKK